MRKIYLKNYPDNIKILTIFITKSKKTFVKGNYERVKRQYGVDQDIYIVSAEPLEEYKENNIVVPIPPALRVSPTPLRVSFSIREALKKINLKSYSYIFKIDGDVKLPLDYLIDILAKKSYVSGFGAAMLISVNFLMKKMKGEYPLSYCDDGYIYALGSAVQGMLPPSYEGVGKIEVHPSPISKQIEYIYGIEYFKFGMPMIVLILSRLIMFLNNPRKFKSLVYSSAGYLSAFLRGENRYEWWRNFYQVSVSIHSWKNYLRTYRRIIQKYKNTDRLYKITLRN